MIHRPLIAFLLVPLLAFTASAVSPPQGCGGCGGSGGSSTANGGSCGGSVSVTVTMLPGKCKWVLDEFGVLWCRQTRGCTPSVTRTWSGLAPNSALDFCVTLVLDGELCLTNPPNAGPTGSGTDTRLSAEMSCSSDPSNTRSYSIESPSCGLSAAADATCSDCSGV